MEMEDSSDADAIYRASWLAAQNSFMMAVATTVVALLGLQKRPFALFVTKSAEDKGNGAGKKSMQY